MPDLFGCVLKRRSYRGAYLDSPVPRGHLELIMEAGLAAPSGCNAQTTSLVGIDDPALAAAITALVKANGFAGGSAPAGVCVLTRPIPAYADVLFNVQDYSAAIQNMLLAITALGYESCWIEGQVTESEETQRGIARLLRLPEEYAVAAFLPVGLPAGGPKAPKKRPFCERAWYNAYGEDRWPT